jgi:hypothetical protein
MLIRSVVWEILKSQVTIAWARKLAGVFVVSFVAAAGNIWARRIHKEPGSLRPRPPPIGRPRP